MIFGTLGRYLARSVVLGVLLVAVLLVGLYTLVELVREARELTGDYGPLQMAVYLLQTTPGRLYDIFPFAALIGTMLALGGLAASNELLAMRASGFDRTQVATSVLVTVAGCLFALVLMSEYLVPDLEAGANANRDQLRSGQVNLGHWGALWLRDGALMVRIGYSAWSGEGRPEFGRVLIYELGEEMRPVRVIQAESATHDGAQWHLRDVEQRRVGGVAETRSLPTMRLASTLSYDLFSSAVTKPRMLAVTDLLAMIDLLSANDLDTGPYRQALWTRAFFPLNVLAMVLVSLPFAFRNARQGGRGLSLFAGVTLGLVFFVVSRMIREAAPLWPGPLWVLMLLPAVVFGAVGVLFLRRA